MAIVNSYTVGMPTPDRTSLDAIVRAARDLLEHDGLPGVTMQAVARRVGVRAPSLYKRVDDRDELLRLVAESALEEIAEVLRDASTVEQVLNGFRSYSKQHPATFQLTMTPAPGLPSADQQTYAASAEVILRATADLVGEADALEAARVLTAWATGFISMEISGSFHLGGDVDAAWEFGLTRLVAAISTPVS